MSTRKLHAPRPMSKIWTDCGILIIDEKTVAEHADDVDCRTCLFKRESREERARVFRASGASGAWLNR